MKILKKVAMISLSAAIAVLVACGTVNGVGKDVSTVGHDIQRSTR